MSTEIQIKPMLSNGAIMKGNINNDGGALSIIIPQYLHSDKICVMENITIPNINKSLKYYEDISKPQTILRTMSVFTYYCETGKGLQYNTKGDGSPNNPFKSIQYALDTIIPIINCLANYFCENDFYVQLKCSGIADYEVKTQVACKSLILNGANFEITKDIIDFRIFEGFVSFINSTFTISCNKSQTSHLLFGTNILYNCTFTITNNDDTKSVIHDFTCAYTNYIFNCKFDIRINSSYTQGENKENSGVAYDEVINSNFAINNELEFNISIDEKEHHMPGCYIKGIHGSRQYNNSFKSNISISAQNTTDDNYQIGAGISLRCFEGGNIYNSSVENVLSIDNAQIVYSVFPCRIHIECFYCDECYNCTHTTKANAYAVSIETDEYHAAISEVDGFGYYAEVIDNCTDNVSFSATSENSENLSCITYYNFSNHNTWDVGYVLNCTGIASLSADGWIKYCGIYSVKELILHNNFVQNSICTELKYLGHSQYEIGECHESRDFYKYCKS